MNWYIAKGIRVTEKALLERYPSGIPPFVDEVILRADHDAALRRAKAEVWGEVIEGAASLRASVENGIPPHERVGFMRACNEIIGYARAAQIEEGA